MCEYKVINVMYYELNEELNKMAKTGWELHSSVISEFEKILDENAFKSRKFRLIFKRQK
ncbi:hypothetical protein [Candidatus Ruminimicrobium bovinum]|uniref:hypothetical protein n=1 Tax=Candidatus Ruminimicrobium bovinum TaxID=3242779 RepID=UPI0039B8365F